MNVVDEVILPVLVSYYISDRVRKNIVTAIKNSRINTDDKQIHLYMNGSNEVEDALRLIQSKSSKTTIGNKYIYEYELDVFIPEGNIFTFKSARLIVSKILTILTELNFSVSVIFDKFSFFM